MCRPPPTPHLFVTIPPPPLLAPSYLHLHTHLNKYIIIHKTLERTYTVYLLIILFKVNCTCVHRVHILTFLLYGPRFEFPASMLMLQYYHAAILFAEYSLRNTFRASWDTTAARIKLHSEFHLNSSTAENDGTLRQVGCTVCCLLFF